MSQASTSKELSQVKNAVSEEDVPRPSGPDEQVAGPSGPAVASSQAEVNGSGPSGPVEQVQGPSGPAEKVSGPSGPLESESVHQVAEEEEAVAPEPPAPSSTQTPVPPSPPSSSTAPPAPQTFKKPQPRTISSPTPFPSQSTSSPISSTTIPSPPPIFAVPPDSSSAGASSSSSPPSSGPSDIPPTTSHSLLHPSPPPSFITIIPEDAQLESPYLGKVKDEFEEVILRSILKVGHHIHRADSSSSAPKKRKASSLSSKPSFPPLWFYLTVDNRNKPLYREYLQKEFLVAGEQEIVHTKPFFFPFSSAATCINCPLEVDQRVVRLVLNATTLVVAFWFPPRSGPRLHVRRVSRAGQHADVDLKKVTPYSVAGQTEISRLCLARGRNCCGVLGRFGIWESFSAWSRCEDIARSGGDAVSWLVFAFFTKGEIRRGVPGLGFLPVKATDTPVAF
ncbi:hypothetical protein Taro_036965 [Colocasia esculenta]|uniref:Uncharacterized protein n=1 Tax=Colocasia esculenta TaxID=4460 RepID=A0A843VZ36_COLES|nr:hypothetical protein [Colocasia esculenta]